MTTPAPTPTEPTGTPVVPPVPAPAPAAPAPAPAAPAPAPAPAPALPPLDGDEDKKGNFTYDATGDSKLDLTLAFVGKHGFGPGHPAMLAAVNGDFSILRAALAEKGVAGADAYLALGEAAYEKMHGENEKRRAADKEAIHAIVGGEENWTKVQEWAGANADADEKPILAEMLSKGGAGAKIAASFLSQAYQQATGADMSTEGAGARPAATNGAASHTTDALAPKDYGRAVAEARRKHSNRDGDFEQSKAYSDLVRRRAAWKE